MEFNLKTHATVHVWDWEGVTLRKWTLSAQFLKSRTLDVRKKSHSSFDSTFFMLIPRLWVIKPTASKNKAVGLICMIECSPKTRLWRLSVYQQNLRVVTLMLATQDLLESATVATSTRKILTQLTYSFTKYALFEDLMMYIGEKQLFWEVFDDHTRQRSHKKWIVTLLINVPLY